MLRGWTLFPWLGCATVLASVALCLDSYPDFLRPLLNHCEMPGDKCRQHMLLLLLFLLLVGQLCCIGDIKLILKRFLAERQNERSVDHDTRYQKMSVF